MILGCLRLIAPGTIVRMRWRHWQAQDAKARRALQDRCLSASFGYSAWKDSAQTLHHRNIFAMFAGGQARFIDVYRVCFVSFTEAYVFLTEEYSRLSGMLVWSDDHQSQLSSTVLDHARRPTQSVQRW